MVISAPVLMFRRLESYSSVTISSGPSMRAVLAPDRFLASSCSAGVAVLPMRLRTASALQVVGAWLSPAGGEAVDWQPAESAIAASSVGMDSLSRCTFSPYSIVFFNRNYYQSCEQVDRAGLAIGVTGCV